ncbi:MMPL family transporter [SAR202 cluster bacterium AC-647-N09_OGT_505m]|nr:MMPL family transporter [SAR202 cluster bacterium AC-647-N09_OGT_505m]
MNLSTESLARSSSKHPWWTVLAWLLVLVGAYALSSTLVESALDGTGGPTQTLEFERAQNLIDERFEPLDSNRSQPGGQEDADGGRLTLTEFILITSESIPANDPAFVEHSQQFSKRLYDDADSLIVGSFNDYEPTTSLDETTNLFRLQIFEDQDAHIALLTDTAAEFSRDGFRVLVFGDSSINAAFSELAEEDLLVGESIGIGVALVILALVFGAVIAGLVPIVLAIVSVFTAIGLTGIIGQFIELNEFVPNIITMMGLAVGIDYSLFVLSRYREERDNGLNKSDAIAKAGGTASRAVFFSGGTVVLALTGMLLIPERTFIAFGVGSILVVFVAVLTCLTLLPALIGILGDRVNGVRVPAIPLTILFIVGIAIIPNRTEAGRIMIVAAIVIGLLIVAALLRRFFGISIPLLSPKLPSRNLQRRGFWDTITWAVMRKPIISLLIAVIILGTLIVPFFDLLKGTSGISVLPDEEPTKQAFEVLNEKYGFGSDSPARVVIDGNVDSPHIQEAVDKLESLMAADPGLQPPHVRVEPGMNLAVLDAAVPGDPFAQAALNTIRRIREEIIPEAFAGVPSSDYIALVGGASAEIVDSVKITDDYTPRVFGAVLGLSFFLLLLAFRSIVIPIASIFMNLLSVGAAYGLVVLVFQKGFLIDAFGFQKVDQLEFWLPLFMFSILFGLSMDYHVFMLSRIKEHYDETGNHADSVAFGLRTTARIITGAALIMVAVFGGFALGDIAFFQSMGFGLGAAILLDATIVRSLLVPSVLRILGKSSWYFPAALNWIPNVSIEGKSPDSLPPTSPP